MKLYHLVKHWALEGLSWMEDGYMQVTYISAIISELMILHKIDKNSVLVYCAIFGVHLLFLYALGYLRYRLEAYNLERAAQIIFLLTILGIEFFAIKYIGIVKTVTILTIPFFVTAIHVIIADRIVCLEEDKEIRAIKWLNCITNRFPKLRFVVWLLLPTVLVVIPLTILEWNVYFKVTIFVIYLLSIPFISRAADFGMDMLEMVVWGED